MNGNLAYQEDFTQELIGGEVVMMAPALSNHNRIARNLTRIFDTYLMGKTCEYFPDGEGLFLSEEEEYIPDGMIVCDPGKVTYKGIFGAPDLVVEILSRASAKQDRGHKKETYARYGVREYWIIDPVRCTVEQYLLHGDAFSLEGSFHRASGVRIRCSLYDDLTVPTEEIFARVSQ